MICYGIYIGLNDPINHQQLFKTEEYIKTLKNVCNSYHVGFSFTVIQGGYINDSGNYEEEKTLYLTLFDIEEKTIKEIAMDLCTFFRQEKVMVTEEQVKMYYVRGDSEVFDVGQSQ